MVVSHWRIDSLIALVLGWLDQDGLTRRLNLPVVTISKDRDMVWARHLACFFLSDLKAFQHEAYDELRGTLTTPAKACEFALQWNRNSSGHRR
jgi:hypothetical protein